MPLPSTITAADLARIEQRKTDLQADMSNIDKSSTSNTAQITAAQNEEITNTKMWVFYNDNIISVYEAELEGLNGVVITLPLTSTDLINRANSTGRLYDPSQAEPDIIRIDQFDGTPTTTNADHELYRLASYAAPITRLTTGLINTDAYSGVTVDDLTAGPIDTEITIEMVDTTGLTEDLEVLCSGSGHSVIATVVSVSSDGECSDPLYETQITCEAHGETWTVSYYVTLKYVTPLSGDIAAGGAVVGTWSGFDNSDRTSKTASDSDLQDLMDYWVGIIDANLLAQIGFIEDQIALLPTNQDPLLDANVLPASISIKGNYVSYQAVLDLSDTGISNLAAINASRTTQINNRVSAINSAKGVYYDNRYEWAKARSGMNGSLTAIYGLQDSNTTLTDQKARCQEQLDLYNSEF